MTLSNYNSNENADFNSGEMILSNYDFNETANYEPSESEDIYILIPDITSMICDHIITKFYYRKYMLKKILNNGLTYNDPFMSIVEIRSCKPFTVLLFNVEIIY